MTDSQREQYANASWRAFRYRGDGVCASCPHKARGQRCTPTGGMQAGVWCNVRHITDCPAARSMEVRA